MNTMIRITKKEFGTFFSSQAAYLFLGVFLAANLFIFFWLESFLPETLQTSSRCSSGCRSFLSFCAARLPCVCGQKNEDSAQRSSCLHRRFPT